MPALSLSLLSRRHLFSASWRSSCVQMGCMILGRYVGRIVMVSFAAPSDALSTFQMSRMSLCRYEANVRGSRSKISLSCAR
jgi:hypothetical protein